MSEIRVLLGSDRYTYLPSGVLYYDFATTVHLVVERYWSRPLSLASCFFFLNRYTAVLAHAPIFYESFGVMPELVSRCSLLQASIPPAERLPSEVLVIEHSRRIANLHSIVFYRCRQLQKYHQIYLMFSQSIVGSAFSQLSCIYSALFSWLKYLTKFVSCFAPMHSACMIEECSIF